VPGEEFGFLGAATVLFLFTVLLAVGLPVSNGEPVQQLCRRRPIAILATHVFVNIGRPLASFP
jgi:cell division protein FtsW (lipid II flippase)